MKSMLLKPYMQFMCLSTLRHDIKDQMPIAQEMRRVHVWACAYVHIFKITYIERVSGMLGYQPWS